MATDSIGRLLDAVLSIAEDLELEAVLQRIVEAARDLVDAQYAALGVISHRQVEAADTSFLSSFVHQGMEPSIVAEIGELPSGHGILGLLIAHPEPIRLADLARHPASVGFPEGHPPMASFLGAPIRVHGQVWGNLYLTEKAEGQEFTDHDQGMVEALAAVAGAAIANANLFVEVQRLSRIEDREQIGRDLHDTVIQRLFATGLSLQAVSRRMESVDETLASRVAESVDDLDETIRQIRGVIFSLQDTGASTGLRSRATALARELAPVLGMTPQVSFDGPVDLLASGELATQVVTVLREALTNVARHAQASDVAVQIHATPTSLEVVVTDDGIGLPEVRRVGGMGLSNLAKRANDLGGEFEILSQEVGTVLRWRVPL